MKIFNEWSSFDEYEESHMSNRLRKMLEKAVLKCWVKARHSEMEVLLYGNATYKHFH